MNKKELIDMVAERTEMTKKDSSSAVDAVIESITEGLEKGEKIRLTGFGTFEVRTRAARDGHNPSTGEKIRIPETKSPAFKAGKNLKEAVKNS